MIVEINKGVCKMIVETKDKSGITYYIDEEKRTVVCKLRGAMFDVLDNLLSHYSDVDFEHDYTMKDCYVGKAKCSPEDKWDTNTGKRIALCRALVSYYNDRDKVFMKVCNDLVSIKNYCLDQSIYAGHKADSYRDELNKHLG